jgi:hypothetical protein
MKLGIGLWHNGIKVGLIMGAVGVLLALLIRGFSKIS